MRQRRGGCGEAAAATDGERQPEVALIRDRRGARRVRDNGDDAPVDVERSAFPARPAKRGPSRETAHSIGGRHDAVPRRICRCDRQLVERHTGRVRIGDPPGAAIRGPCRCAAGATDHSTTVVAHHVGASSSVDDARLPREVYHCVIRGGRRVVARHRRTSPASWPRVRSVRRTAAGVGVRQPCVRAQPEATFAERLPTDVLLQFEMLGVMAPAPSLVSFTDSVARWSADMLGLHAADVALRAASTNTDLIDVEQRLAGTGPARHASAVVRSPGCRRSAVVRSRGRLSSPSPAPHRSSRRAGRQRRGRRPGVG